MPQLAESSHVGYINEWGGAPPQDILAREVDRLLRATERANASGGERDRPVIVLDQFEDVFKVSAKRSGLWDTLADFVNRTEPAVNVIVSMREEWLGAWGESADYIPDGLNNHVRLSPLSEAELKRAIVRPAAIEGTISVDARFAERLIEDLRTTNAFGLGENYVEPGMLQLVCNRLWHEANERSLPVVDVELYDSLGRSERIIRDFVWNQLGRVGSGSASFTQSDRVLWAGISRHLMAAPGIKAIVTPMSLARKLEITDLGVVGRAVVSKALPAPARKYLERKPNVRAEPPEQLVTWISDVLKKGSSAGFLKRQAGFDERENLYELSHDRLGEILAQFTFDFQERLRKRWRILMGVQIGIWIAILAGSFIYSEASTGRSSLSDIAGKLAILFFGLPVEVAVFWGFYLFGKWISRLLFYPLTRRLAAEDLQQPGGR